MTLFSDEQLVALSNVLDRAIFAAASSMSAVSSTMTATLPAPTPIAGVPLAYAARTLVCEPVATTRSACRISSNVCSRVTGAGSCMHEIARRADAVELRMDEPRAAAQASIGLSATARE